MSITEYAKLQENNLDLIQEIYSEYNDLLNMRNDMAEHGYDTDNHVWVGGDDVGWVEIESLGD